MKNSILFLSIILISFFSCKKKDTKESAPSSTGGTTTGGLSGATHGSLQTILIHSYNGNTFSFIDSSASASFYTPGSMAFLNAGNVFYNGTRLKKYTSYYSDTTNLINIHQPSGVWNVTGSIDVPTFTFAVTPNYAVFTGNSSLPDSLSKSSSLTINLTGVSNCSAGISVTLYDGINYINKSIISPGVSCTFSASELSSLSVTNAAFIIITFSNGFFSTIGGKQYYFDYVLQHNKFQIKIKP